MREFDPQVQLAKQLLTFVVALLGAAIGGAIGWVFDVATPGALIGFMITLVAFFAIIAPLKLKFEADENSAHEEKS